MGFVGKHCFSFTASSIRQNAPALSGVYGISNAGHWLFVGGADDLQQALWRHLGEVGTRLRAAAPTGFTVEVCDDSARPQRLSRLIEDLSPSCNSPE